MSVSGTQGVIGYPRGLPFPETRGPWGLPVCFHCHISTPNAVTDNLLSFSRWIAFETGVVSVSRQLAQPRALLYVPRVPVNVAVWIQVPID